MAQDVMPEFELLSEGLVAFLEIGAVDGCFFLGVGLEPCLEIGLNVDGAVFPGLGNFGGDADDLVAQVDVLPDVLSEERELAEFAGGELRPDASEESQREIRDESPVVGGLDGGHERFALFDRENLGDATLDLELWKIVSGVGADPVPGVGPGPFKKAVDVGADVVLSLPGPVVLTDVSVQVLQFDLVQLLPIDVGVKARERAPELRDRALADASGPFIPVEILQHIRDGVVAIRGAVVGEKEIDRKAEGVVVAQAFESILRLGDLAIAQGGDGGAVLALQREHIVVLLLLVEGLGVGGEILANALAVDGPGNAPGVATATIFELSDVELGGGCHASTVANKIGNRNINR